MLETTFFNPQQKKIPVNDYLHNKPNNFSVANDKMSQQSHLRDQVNIHKESFLHSLTYSSSMTIKGDEGVKYQLLQRLVVNFFQAQSINTEIVIEDNKVNITQLSQEEAQELVSDEGYFGVEQTAERIFQLAITIAAGDPAKIDAVKEGIEKGFQKALDAFNGWLPDISYQTYDRVMAKLDNWVAEK